MLATPALARNNAWYVGGDFGAMIVEDIPFEFQPGDPIIPTGTAQVEIDHNYGFDGALLGGYDLGAFRLETEVSYRQADLDELEHVIALPGFNQPQGRSWPAFAGRSATISKRGTGDPPTD